ncbi:MAG: N-acetylmannosamine-6-phosphate 2-epimerase [Chitinophagales bacterium]
MESCKLGSQTSEFLARTRGGLIVSCQALEHEPLHGPFFMAAMAYAAEGGGAVGIRANSPEDLRAIRRLTALPLIGLWKVTYPGHEVYLTPTLSEAAAVAGAGADVIAIDATGRPRPGGVSLPELIRLIHSDLGKPVLADVSTRAEGLAAAEAGADLVSTALAGYTAYSRHMEGPDLDLVSELAACLPVPVLAEGRIWTPEEAQKALTCGAHAIVVGGAITRPQQITQRFATALAALRG